MISTCTSCRKGGGGRLISHHHHTATMFTLHMLKESRKRSHESLVGSTCDDTRNALPNPSEPIPFDPTTTGDTYPWGFEQEDLDRFPALKRRNFWCIQRHQARGTTTPIYDAVCTDQQLCITTCGCSWTDLPSAGRYQRVFWVSGECRLDGKCG